MQAHSSVNDESIEEIYEQLKLRLQDGRKQDALLYLHTINFAEVWDRLLHHSMKHRNCPVSKLIVVQIANRKLLTREQIQKRISQVDHEIQKEFMARLSNFAKSPEFERQLEEYNAVRHTVGRTMQAAIGTPLLNPNELYPRPSN